MNQMVAMLQQPGFWAGALALATPLLFGVLGTIVCERAGIRNYGIEGIFVAGALAGFAALHMGAGPWTGVLIAALAGAAFGLVHGILTAPFGLSQPLTGIAITLLATSLSYAAFRLMVPEAAALAPVKGFAPINPAWFAALPYVGEGLAQFAAKLTPLSYLAFILVLVIGHVLRRTPLGVVLRACGDNPAALTVQGRSVHAMRIGADLAGAALMGIGGACLTLAATQAFGAGIAGGRGWLCLALVICARWRLGMAFLMTLLLGAVEAYEIDLRRDIPGIPLSELLPLLPFVLVIVALALFGRRHYPPAALLVPYAKRRRDRDA